MTVCLAPAKVNLSLRVLSKREDGFHELDTVMAPLDLCDELHFHNSRTTTIICDAPGVPTDESNLIFKAVRVFEESYGRKAKQRIELTKNIPHGAGLGGGSSDAATTLMALNEILSTQYDADEIGAMAASLGSDLNFFLEQGPCRCSGRGEIVKQMEDFASWRSPIVLIKPDFSVLTPLAFKDFADSLEISDFHYLPQMVDGLELVNDLERPVFARFPILGMMKRWLLEQAGVRGALMSGSGSTLYALTENTAQATRIAAHAKKLFGSSLYTYCGWVNAGER